MFFFLRITLHILNKLTRFSLMTELKSKAPNVIQDPVLTVTKPSTYTIYLYGFNYGSRTVCPARLNLLPF